MEIIFFGLLAFLGIILLFFLFTYNYLITLRNRIDNAWSQIDVQLKKRADLVPNLVETVKGYAKHEKELFNEVTRARAASISANTVAEKAQADNMLSQTLKSLFAVAENYPTLKANENFRLLQEELSGIENKIAYARQFYNDNVLAYNIAIQSVPTNIVAGMFGFTAREFFKVAEEERQNVKVKF
ncbi:MAG: LemA family protein [Candidatus Micrarchaeota archaeon]|nr:LemA family protein [Candidatus Micrarchaeota archaeon]